MKTCRPDWLNPAPLVERCRQAGAADVSRAIACREPGAEELAILLSPAAARFLESMAQRAQAITRRHFGRTISLYVPLYLSNYCSGGCRYCGFAADRRQPRRRLEQPELLAEIRQLKHMGLEDVLLLTGERNPKADFDYLLTCVAVAARHFHNVTIESFAMTTDEYRRLAAAGCTGMTIYQETYDPGLYSKLHRWGPKRDYRYRIEAPERALEAGLRTIGLAALLGLNDPVFDTLAMFQHVEHIRKTFWQAGILVSFPRLCSEQGGFQAAFPFSDRSLAQTVYAFRICLPDVPLVLSTRERPAMRDGLAGVGISRMSVASRTSVGGYDRANRKTGGQFDVNDTRNATRFCQALRRKGLEPVFKNWDSIFQQAG